MLMHRMVFHQDLIKQVFHPSVIYWTVTRHWVLSGHPSGLLVISCQACHPSLASKWTSVEREREREGVT